MNNVLNQSSRQWRSMSSRPLLCKGAGGSIPSQSIFIKVFGHDYHNNFISFLGSLDSPKEFFSPLFGVRWCYYYYPCYDVSSVSFFFFVFVFLVQTLFLSCFLLLFSTRPVRLSVCLSISLLFFLLYFHSKAGYRLFIPACVCLLYTSPSPRD